MKRKSVISEESSEENNKESSKESKQNDNRGNIGTVRNGKEICLQRLCLALMQE